MFNTKNHSLRMYTDPTISANSEKTDLSDVGLCSFSVAEASYNMLLCYICLDDKTNSLQMLNDLFKNIPKKFANGMLLLRALVLDHFGSPEKAQNELKRFKQADSKTYDSLFNQKTNRANKTVHLLEVFPSADRLCSLFEPVTLPIATKGLGSNF